MICMKPTLFSDLFRETKDSTHRITIPETNIFAPENSWERRTIAFPIGEPGNFSGAFAVKPWRGNGGLV